MAKHPNEWHDDSSMVHDLLMDYSIFKSGYEIANLHKKLFDAYKAEYPGGLHTISVNDFFYFQKNWWNHAVKARIEVDLVKEIAADLMTNNFIDHVPAFISILNGYDDFLLQRKNEECQDLLIKMRGLLDQLPAENKNLISNLFPDMRILKKNDSSDETS